MEPQNIDNVLDLSDLEHMTIVSSDLFSLYEKDYLLIVDRASSYPWVRRIRNQSAAELVAKADEIFLEVGYPKILRSDGARCFQGGFERWLKDHSIQHQVTSAYCPQSNGF